MWATWDNVRDVVIQIQTSGGSVLRSWTFDYGISDLPIYEFWDYFCVLNRNSIGLILGAGNGRWGEWVIPVNREFLECHLVEASEGTFRQLVETYEGNPKIKLHNKLVTADGLDCKFYEGQHSDGLNTTNFEYLKKIDSTANENFTWKKSVSIRDLISEIGPVNWIRMDLEGIDFDIIKSLDLEFIRSLRMLQYEHFHLQEEKREEIDSIMIPLGFTKLVYNIDTIYVKF